MASLLGNKEQDAIKPHKEDTNFRGSLDLEVRPHITPIPLCSKGKDANARYKISCGFTRVT